MTLHMYQLANNPSEPTCTNMCASEVSSSTFELHKVPTDSQSENKPEVHKSNNLLIGLIPYTLLSNIQQCKRQKQLIDTH